jgi:DNA-binding NarL/FixJ family response regulator
MPKSLRILAVDDHEKVRRGICTLLRADPDLEVTCEDAARAEVKTIRKKKRNVRNMKAYSNLSPPEVGGLFR